MINRKALLTDLRQQVTALEKDLAQQVRTLRKINTSLRAEYDQAREAFRTAATWNSWLDERITQAAAAWVLGTVFVRFTEDNGLIPEPYLAGSTPERYILARSRHEAYVEQDDDPTYRGWLEKAFAELGEGQAGELLFDQKHNPLYQIPVSHDAAGALIDFWKTRTEKGTLVHDFTDPLNEDGTKGWDTRFLGDLYQDLSEAARSTYALLQTPEFVEDFILDRAMDPSLREFGHEDFKMIDPTCGSGHFVLGAFRRLITLWNKRQPDCDRVDRVRAALDSVHGTDINPFAVAIARFRLLIAAMAAAEIHTLADAARYEWPINVAIGDSLIKARQLELTLIGDETSHALADFTYATEDVHDFPDILKPGRYHTVVGNPPYITVKDQNLNQLYRELYATCSGSYALTIPFAERFFELSKKGNADGVGYGQVGQITSNSFMKRKFGAHLIEQFFRHEVELTEVIDTSGAFIPGHGTPTVILIGKPRCGSARGEKIRTVRSIQGEPGIPDAGSSGMVWNAIKFQIDRPGTSGKWVSVDDLSRSEYFDEHPWILSDGGLELVSTISHASGTTLGEVAEVIGPSAVTREDDAYMVGAGHLRRRGIPTTQQRPLVEGTQVRDYSIRDPQVSIWPYKPSDLTPDICNPSARILWPFRRRLQKRVAFGKTQLERGLAWFEYSMFFKDRYRNHPSIVVPETATLNHFAIDRSGAIFKDTAPAIKLPPPDQESDCISLIGILNSSTICFWLKMNCHDKGIRGEGGGFTSSEWERFYQIKTGNLARIPIPPKHPVRLSKTLDYLAQELHKRDLNASNRTDHFTASYLRDVELEWSSVRAQMIAVQEELDWQVYSIYGLHPEDLRAPEEDVPELALGERAFEIVLARRVANGEASDEWFKRHGSTPITEIPSHWPESYKAVVQKRIEAIESSRAIGMIERPEYKRRWATEGWDAMQQKALRSWLLDRIETREHWFDASGSPTLGTLSRLTDLLSQEEDFVSVAKIYEPRKELAKVVAELVANEHVPFLAQLRYKPSGLRKRADWEKVWDLQRQEDAAPDELAKRKIRDSIPTPPKYSSSDFLKPSYWRARGKLDVPKERFISYPTHLGEQPTLFGWAGWDHREQAQALATYFTNQAMTQEEILPFLAGLLEIQPWLNQWHNEFHPLYSGSPAVFFDGYRQQKQGEHGLTDDDLRTWQPERLTRGRKAAKK